MLFSFFFALLLQNFPGCIDCYLCQEIGDESVFTFIDTFENEDAIDKKMASEAVGNFLKELGDSVTVDMKRFTVC